jgi:solute carrier family 25 (mitochondrial carnitine/acylcarnitine transporter), member 20/29
MATWTSIYPLDVIKTRLQAGSTSAGTTALRKKLPAWAIAKEAYRTEGWQVFFRGLGVCNVRAFGVNAVQVSRKFSFLFFFLFFPPPNTSCLF